MEDHVQTLRAATKKLSRSKVKGHRSMSSVTEI